MPYQILASISNTERRKRSGRQTHLFGIKNFPERFQWDTDKQVKYVIGFPPHSTFYTHLSPTSSGARSEPTVFCSEQQSRTSSEFLLVQLSTLLLQLESGLIAPRPALWTMHCEIAVTAGRANLETLRSKLGGIRVILNALEVRHLATARV